jgi:WD40 repeat protein
MGQSRVTSTLNRGAQETLRFLERRWGSVRSFAYGLWIARISTASVLIGAAVFYYARAAQDLFLEVLDRWYWQLGYWCLFYVVVLLFWVFPVYLSARWILCRPTASGVEAWVRRGVPPLLAAACLGAVLIGQVLAVSNAPILTDAGITENRVEILDEQMKTACPAWERANAWSDLLEEVTSGKCRALDLLIAGSRSMGLSFAKALGSDLLILVLYAICALVSLWMFLKHRLVVIGRKSLWSAEALLYGIASGLVIIPIILSGIIITPLLLFNLNFDDVVDKYGTLVIALLYLSSFVSGTLLWWYRGEAILWWIVTCLLGFPIIAITLMVTFGFVESEMEQPYGLWHLALLPPTTTLIGLAVWWCLRHRDDDRASELAHFLLRIRGVRGSVDELMATERLVKPIFMNLAILSASGLIVLMFLVPPVEAAQDVLLFRRSLLIPFFLGMLVPPLTVLSSWSMRIRAPVIVATIVLIVSIGQIFRDPHRVRAVPTEANLPSLKDSAEQWARVNNCKLNFSKDSGPADPIEACPTPIVVAAAGGASRAAFHFAGLIGALMDGVPPPLIFHGHGAAVHTGLFSPDSRRVVTVSADKTARLWDIKNGKEIANLKHQGGAVYGAVFDPTGRRVLTYSADGDARLWNADDGKQIAVLAHEGPVNSAAFSVDGERVLTRSFDKTARVWDGVTDTAITVMRHNAQVRNAVFSPDRLHVLTVSDDHSARIWNAERDASPIALVHQDEINYAHFSPDGTRVVTSSNDKTARVWDVATGKELATLEHKGAVRNAIFSGDGKTILTISSDRTVGLWEPDGGANLHRLTHESAVNGAIFSPDGRLVLTRSSDKIVRLWDRETGKEVKRLGHAGAVNEAVFSPDGRRILTRTSDKMTVLWDVESGSQVSLKHNDNVQDAVFSPDGSRILTRTSNSSIARLWLWDAKDDHPRSLRHEGQVTGVVFSPDGNQILTYSADTTARLWHSNGLPVSLGDGRKLRPFAKQVFAISAVSGGALGAGIFYAALADSQLRQKTRGASTPLMPPCNASSDTSDLFNITDQKPVPDQKWKDCLQLILAGDFLSPVFLSMITGDLIGVQPNDRTVVLEEAWENRYQAMTEPRDEKDSPLGSSLLHVRDLVLKTQPDAWLPILLFNGTSVQTGRRIIVSDIDTRGLFKDAYDLHERLGGEIGKRGHQDEKYNRWDVRLSTAVTISARFPGISPHGDIMRNKKEIVDRVVDGGYYENFGASTALELTEAFVDVGLSPPLIILVNNEPSMPKLDCDNTKLDVPRAPKPDSWAPFTTLRAPLDAILGTRSARGTHAATQLCQHVKSKNFAFITVSQQVGATKKELSLSWWLSKYVQRYLDVELMKANGLALEKVMNVR